MKIRVVVCLIVENFHKIIRRDFNVVDTNYNNVFDTNYKNLLTGVAAIMLNLLSIPKIQSKMSARDKRNVFNITLGKTNDLKNLIKETHIPEQLKNLIQIFNSKTQK